MEHARWRFRGPWLAGLTGGEFDRYLSKKVRGKREEFHALLKRRMALEMTDENARKAIQAKEEVPPAVDPTSITEEQFTTYLRALRDDKKTLFTLVGRFLDLAPISTNNESLDIYKANKAYERRPDSPYAVQGPPITHPSAGLSYLRTQSYMDNHPIYGPQAAHVPVQARIVTPRSHAQSYSAKLGVGGFITNTPEGSSSFNNRALPGLNKQVIPGLFSFDVNATGGSKIYVTPETATIDATGRVQLKVSESSAQSSIVAKELVGEGEVLESAAVESKLPQPKYARPRGVIRPTTWPVSSSKNYGIGQLPSSGRHL